MIGQTSNLVHNFDRSQHVKVDFFSFFVFDSIRVKRNSLTGCPEFDLDD